MDTSIFGSSVKWVGKPGWICYILGFIHKLVLNFLSFAGNRRQVECCGSVGAFFRRHSFCHQRTLWKCRWQNDEVRSHWPVRARHKCANDVRGSSSRWCSGSYSRWPNAPDWWQARTGFLQLGLIAFDREMVMRFAFNHIVCANKYMISLD